MLTRKMYRDIRENKGSYLACLIVIWIGLLVFTAFSIASDNLGIAQDMFYREQNFADGFIELEFMPQGRLEALRRVEGVEQVTGRIVREVQVYDEDADKAVFLELVSIDLNERDRVNDIRLLEGTRPSANVDQVWIDNQFYEANQLSLGDEIPVIAGGQLRELQLQGVGMSPEFTYPLRTEAEMIPNPEQYGIAFVPLPDMERYFPDLRGGFNDIVFTLEADADYEQVEDRLEREIEGYGLTSIYPRADQISHMVLQEELTALETVSRSVPLLFLIIAAIILYIMLKRLVEQQRFQVGILKALGYTNWQVMSHYLSYALWVGLIGGILGGIFGILFAFPLTMLLMEFFNVPEVFTGFAAGYFIIGVLLALGIFLVSGYHGCKFALSLKPAEAMRPPAPISGRKVFIEKIAFIWEMFTIQGKMALRNMVRNPGRTLFLFVGITLSCAIVALTWSLNEMVDKLVFYQHDEVEVYDARINLAAPLSRTPLLRELGQRDGVARVEPMAEIPVNLAHKWREEDVLLIGLKAPSRLYNVLDEDGRRIKLAEEGIVLSERLSNKLDVSIGDTLVLDSPYLRGEEEKDIAVTDIIPQYLGMNAYMNLSALDETLGQGELATAVLLAVDRRWHAKAYGEGIGTKQLTSQLEGEINTGHRGNSVHPYGERLAETLRREYRYSERIAGIESHEDRIRQARELMETFGSVLYIYVFVGVIIGFVIIYSSSFIILSERSRELASMRVLGMTSREVFSVVAFEQWFISFFAVLAGIPLAQLFQWFLAQEMSTDLYVIPAAISTDSLLAGALISAGAIWIAQRFAFRKVRNLSLIEVLKTRE